MQHEAGGLALPDQASAPPLRVGLFGGAFDPPHKAHRALAQTALQQLALDVLHVLPTGQAWHKTRSLTEAAHRVAMCQLAFGDLPRVRIDDREIRRQGPSYTADTLHEMASEYPGANLYLVLGADQLLAFKSWVRWPEVLAAATLAVAGRAIDAGENAASMPGQEADLSGVDVPFVGLSMPLQNISATAVRTQLEHAAGPGAPTAQLVPEAVASYISLHHLYQTPT